LLPLLANFLPALLCPAALAEEPVRILEAFSPGYQYYVRTRSDVTGFLSVPPEKGKSAPEKLQVKGTGAAEYDERILDLLDKQEVGRTVRICRRTEVRRTIGSREQENSLRQAVRRLVLLRNGNTEVPFSPDGPLLWGEIDLVRTDVFTPALRGLLPERAVKVGDTWTAAEAAVQELTDLRIEDGKIECKLEEMTTLEKRRHARIAFRGTVAGKSEDGPSRQQLEGYLFFDLESNHLSYLFLRGRHSLLDDRGKEVGRIEGRFVLTRQVNTRCPELSDEALRKVRLTPNADNTLLLYDNPDLGLRFLYPRRWHIGVVQGNQLALDSADGHGLLITVDPPSRAPLPSQLLTESRRELEKNKVRILRAGTLQTVPGAAGLSHFVLDAEGDGQKFVMDYYLSRQAAGGATLAARLLPRDLAAVQREVEKIARSVEVTLRAR
jgi:hypothetical protein